MERYKYDEKELKLIESSSIPLAVYQFIDKRVATIALSEGFVKLIGLDSMEEAYYLMDNDMYRDVHPDDVAELADAAVRFAVDGGEYNQVYRSKLGDKYIILHSIGKHIYKENGVRLAVVNYVNEGVYNADNRDIAMGFNLIHKKHFQSKKAATGLSYDYLTGLPTMDYFFELAEATRSKAVNEWRELVMMFFDLSGMQAFNQRYGYEAGDILIKESAKLLVKFFGNYNCCRTTADHFVVCTDREGIDDKLKCLVKDFKLINNGKNLPVKIGVYDTRFGYVGSATATDRAKIACDSCGQIYDSKIVYFDEKMLKKFEDRRYIFENLDNAIEDGWIKVCYQPIIRTSNGKVCNEEALVRWKDPKKGEMGPNDFIPILEDAKITYKLDLYVAEQVIIKLKQQAEAGLNVVPNSINLSKTDFYSCDIVEEIRKRVDEAGIDRSRIVIELTESVVTDDVDYMIIQIKRFRELGFSVWLDDFGRGYSSPDLLQRIHFDVIKLDKAFVDEIHESEDSKVIVSEIVRLARGLGSDTVAEGVEDENPIDFLNEVGCTKLQGYYYSKAVPFDAILDRYKNGVQIGFENPKEAEYYATVGNVNMYDMSFSADDSIISGDYFDTMPMFIVEVKGDEIRHMKGNKSYKIFMEKYYPKFSVSENYSDGRADQNFFNALIQCKKDGKPVIVDIRGKNNDVIHLFIRKVATNEENDAVALSVVMLGYIDNDAELRHKEEIERIKRERMTYNRVTALTGDFICIYAIDPENEHFVRYTLDEDYRYLGLDNEGDNFFEKFREKGLKNVFIEDIDHFLTLFSKENICKTIESNGVYSINIRLMYQGAPKYVCIKATYIIEDQKQILILGIVDVDDQVRKDQNYYKNLAEMSKIANLDSLTGVKNKHAYIDAEAKLNRLIEEKEDLEFATIVFDINGLKEINDSLGHQAGDEFIKSGCSIICNLFKHSPIYRIGGDEFAVIAQGMDYQNIDLIMAELEKINLENQKTDNVVIACGAARYNGERNVAGVFDKADKRMYENKRQLKNYQLPVIHS
ncbi:EAL domain-containing protein [Pseudobutyrivibrio ruminis]|uniref:sensor domain-containing diguanylate cyclase n=1 Tax=Pseudobutyrivibrio ruminis TaxID=46206 RepID=UPI00041484A4|nr:EAL domain-containing protein [Pseudobutyrivibrio ruminis]